MGVDRTTEAIAHFIGLFELKTAQGRLRDTYEEFTALRRKSELDEIESLAAEIRTDFQMRGGEHQPLPVPFVPIPVQPDTWSPFDGRIGGADGVTNAQNTAMGEGAGAGLAPTIVVQDPVPPSLMLPGSMLTVTVQTAALTDNDSLGHGEFRDASGHAADLADLGAIAASLHAPGGFGAAEVPALAEAQALADAVLAFRGEAPEGFEVHTFRGAEAPELLVNGEAVDTAPEWKKLLPSFHRDDADGAADDLEAWELPPGYAPNAETPEGHTLVAGGNLLINEAQIGVSYLDAPVIAVGGDWISLDIISQVAVVSNRDEGIGATDAGRSGVYQVVEIEERSNKATWQAKNDEDETAAPKLLSVEVVTGDLFVSNYVKQTIEFLDNDTFGMSIEAANSAYILGENTVFNVTALVTAGLGYDLIIVGGDFITVDSITQSLVLLDDDWISATFAPPDAPEAAFDAARATATAGEARAAEGGRFASSDDGDADDEDPPHDDAPEPPGNLLMNHATLSSVGTDTAEELSSSLAAILSGGAPDLETLREKLLTDPALAGLEHARVLKIDGSLIQSNTIEQIILASDRDDIRVDGAAPSDLEMIASSNALLNAASIGTYGVDSQVMTGSDGYSDLLIHQASLIDEPTAPESGDDALVSEAVAFLTEDIETGVASKTDGLGTSGEVASDAYDVMSSALA